MKHKPIDDELLLSTSRFDVVLRTQPQADGQTRQREIVLHPGAVVLLPLLPDGRICLIENQRIAVGETLIELPAGTIEPGEDPAVTAARELVEETGYRAARIEALCQFWMSPGILNERMHVFLTTGLTPAEQDLDEGELIQVIPTSWSDALAMIDDGRIQDAKTLAVLLWYNRARGNP
ncbi:MAG: NUDIX hydrolase [Planctomycetota bacterium]|nr:NUDIX hydrolase [Planctomycetota bacterium]